MRKKYKTLRHYLPEIIKKMNQKDIPYNEYGQGFSVKGQSNMENLKILLNEYMNIVDLPDEAWRGVEIEKPPKGYEWSFSSSEMGVDGNGYPFQRLRAIKKLKSRDLKI